MRGWSILLSSLASSIDFGCDVSTGVRPKHRLSTPSAGSSGAHPCTPSWEGGTPDAIILTPVRIKRLLLKPGGFAQVVEVLVGVVQVRVLRLGNSEVGV